MAYMQEQTPCYAQVDLYLNSLQQKHREEITKRWLQHFGLFPRFQKAFSTQQAASHHCLAKA